MERCANDGRYFLDDLNVNVSMEIGKGIIYGVYYDTAWLARIPSQEDLSKPAYPEVIATLLKHQNPDGTWCDLSAHNPCDVLLNTLAVVLALDDWDSIRYQTKIQQAINGLSNLLNQPLNIHYETIGFEMLLPSLIQQCQQKKLLLPENLLAFNANLQPKYLYKKQLIEQAEINSKTFSPQSWWFSAELLGHPKHLTNYSSYYEKMISNKGSVAASPAATAYVVAALRYQGIEVPHAVEYLEKVMASPHSFNAAPNVAPIDEFETAFSANYLFEAGADAQHPLLKSLIAETRKHWLGRNKAGMGYSTHFSTDPDCTANAIMALKYDGLFDLTADILLEKFNGEYVETYMAESVPSISSNLHVLQALQLFKSDIRAKELINKLLIWLNSQAYSDLKQAKFAFTDKWHASPIYPTARAVIALMDLDKALAERCVMDLINNQHPDGGFGALKMSTAEETAFAILALTNWHKKQGSIDSMVFMNAQKFLATQDVFSRLPLWIGKVQYCPRLVVASVITAAKFALASILDSHKVANPEECTMQTLAPRYENADLKNLLFNHYRKWLASLKLMPAKFSMTTDLAEACINALHTDDHVILEIYADYSLLVLTLDDLLDETWDTFDSIEPILSYILGTISNKLAPSIEVNSEVKRIALGYQNILERAKVINPNLGPFIASIKKQFQALEEEFANRKNNTLLSLQRYLTLRAVIGGMDTSAELAFAMFNIQLPEIIRKDADFQAIQDASYKAIILLNDVVSYKREISAGYAGDNFVLLYQAEHQVGLAEAVIQCKHAYQHEVKRLLLHKNKLTKKLADNPALQTQVAQAVTLLIRQVQANVDWVAKAKRYQNG